MNLEDFSIILAFAGFLGFAAKRLMTYLHALQQDDYSNARLLSWIKNKGVFDQRLTFRIFVIGVFYHFQVFPYPVIDAIVCAAFLWTWWKEADPRLNAKKKLVMTARAKRIYAAGFLVLAVTGLWCFKAEANPWVWILNVQFAPFALMLGNLILMPQEKMAQKKFWNEAHEKLKRFNPVVIGITGSYGKTSVKHILGHILKSQAPTLVTPGSVNTPMGIARIVREQLDESHQYFIAEMGAYGPGSIQRLCELAPPSFGIITAIGHAHYERFKTLNTVAAAKYELAQAVMKAGGKMVVPESALDYGAAQRIYEVNKENFMVMGQDVKIKSAKQTDKGLDITLSWKKKSYDLKVPLYGMHHAENIALSFAAALALGMEAEDIINALKSVPQITHRLEVKPQPDGTTIIDDAYNSNPAGFKAGLELLRDLKEKGRTILITPGMVELGDAHDEEHEKIGRLAGEICDACVAVSPARIRAFTNAFKETGGDKPLIQVQTFEEASIWLSNNKQKGDVILLENDLPDLYERVPKL